MKSIELLNYDSNLKALEDYELIDSNGGLVLFSTKTAERVWYYTNRFIDGFIEGLDDGIQVSSQ